MQMAASAPTGPNYTLWSAGSNARGRLGDGTTTNRSSPTQAGSDTDWGYSANKVDGGDGSMMMIKSDGSLWGMGNNNGGMLGLGTTTSINSNPTQVGALTTWATVNTGAGNGGAIKSDGTLWMWGYNTLGQLGQGDATNRSSPVQVGGQTDWAAIAIGGYHSVGIKTTGKMYSWGFNTKGQLGLGDTTVRSSPVQIGGLTTWSKVACGRYATVAIKTDGTAWAWGENNYGMLGDGSNTNRSSPVQIGSLTTWANVACGRWHTALVKTDGTLWGCGHNGSGQLGQGDSTHRSSPVQVGSLTNWSIPTAGTIGQTTWVLKTDNTIWGIGNNGSGHLGDGTDANRSSPVQFGSDAAWYAVGGGSNNVTAVRKED